MKDYIRLTDVLMNYWQGLGKTEGLPLESEIKPENLVRVWEDCFLVQVKSDRHFKYDYMGKNLVDAFGDDLKKDDAEELVSADTHRVVEKFSEVVHKKRPFSDEGEFTDARGMLVKYRQLLLPFSDKKNEGKVSYILGGMRWKAF